MSKSPRRKYLFRKLLVILGRNNEKQKKHYEYEKTTFDYAGDGCTATQRAEY